MSGELARSAWANLERHLKSNAYPGRGLVIGRSPAREEWLLVYWIMGRSASSRSRRFVSDGTTLRTEPLDAAPPRDASLLVYEAMLEAVGLHVVGNGDQTRTAFEALQAGTGFEEALAGREREPDAPNYTPRITGLLDLREARPALALSILRANDADPAQSDRFCYRPAPPPPGLAFGITTYQGDGRPLPPFRGEPLWLPLPGDASAVLERYWDALDPENRVALAVKSLVGSAPGRILIRNRHPAR